MWATFILIYIKVSFVVRSQIVLYFDYMGAVVQVVLKPVQLSVYNANLLKLSDNDIMIYCIEGFTEVYKNRSSKKDLDQFLSVSCL